VCNCDLPTPTVKEPALKAPGSDVRIRYHGAIAGVEVIGGVSGKNYGYRCDGQIFVVDKRDAEQIPDVFEVLPDLAPISTPVKTTAPPAPELLR
jgi:hypothetical protein